MNNDIYEIIGRILNGEASAEDQEKLDKWVAASGKNLAEFDFLIKTWEQTKIQYKAPNREVVFKNILAEIDDQHEKAISGKKKNTVTTRQLHKTNHRYFLVSKIAAGLIILLSFIFVIHYFGDNKENISTIQYVTKANGAGQKSKVYLPDGSIVWLNSESEISYPDTFPDNTRIVKLKGEAFFKITPNAFKPFTVITGRVSTTALGTSFDIRAFKDDQDIRIALATGKVKVNFSSKQANKEVILMPNQGISYNLSKNKITKSQINPKETFSWKDGIIYFNDASLNEVVKTLSRWYGVEFIIMNKDNQPWSYTGEFDNAYLQNVLESISFTKNFDFKLDNKKVTINFNPEN